MPTKEHKLKYKIMEATDRIVASFVSVLAVFISHCVLLLGFVIEGKPTAVRRATRVPLTGSSENKQHSGRKPDQAGETQQGRGAGITREGAGCTEMRERSGHGRFRAMSLV